MLVQSPAVRLEVWLGRRELPRSYGTLGWIPSPALKDEESALLPQAPIPDKACTVRGRSRRWPQKAAMRLRSDWTTPVSRKRGNPSKART